MRIIVNCTGGSSHSMMLLNHTTVLDVKEYVAEREGVPVGNQALLFAGRHLSPDTALLLQELQFDSYSLANEVVVYMQPQLSQPVRVYLSKQPGSANCRMFPEVVEASSTLTNIQDLLAERQLTCMPFPPAAHSLQETGQHASTSAQQPAAPAGAACTSTDGEAPTQTKGGAHEAGVAAGSSNVVVKRQDGSCCSKVCVEEICSIQELLEAIWAAEGKSPTSLSFYQARDGCLHAVYGDAWSGEQLD